MFPKLKHENMEIHTVWACMARSRKNSGLRKQRFGVYLAEIKDQVVLRTGFDELGTWPGERGKDKIQT